MPPHPSYVNEKSPIDNSDYEGLQLDTRARETQDKHLDESKPQGFLDDDFDDSGNYLNEKQSHAAIICETSPTSPESSHGAGFSPISPGVSAKDTLQTGLPPKSLDETVGSPPPVPPERKICGLRRKHFWALFGLLLVLLVTAAVIGGVVGGLQARNGSSHAVDSASTPPSNNTMNNSSAATFTSVKPEDVTTGSPLAMVTYDEGPGESFEDRQVFRMCFQTANGNIKEAVSYHLEAWQSAVPIFTDAINNTGLATVTYLNGTSQQGNIFYVGTNGLLQEKRKIYNDTHYWEPGTLNSLNIAMMGNVSLPSQGDDPTNGWEGYRMAAVYSVNFDNGPGIRLFYHAAQLNGSAFVQELIWIQKNDSWSRGAELQDPYPNSHLAVAIDETSKILRIFYSSGNKGLKEEWLNITNTKAGYYPGLRFDSLLYDNAADIAAVALYGTTYVYHYSASSQRAEAGIHELSITGVPNSINDQETYNLSSPLVAAPSLAVNGKISPYQPLAASYSAVMGVTQQLYVFWADKVSGDPTTESSGFTGLSQISRPIANSTWARSSQQPIPIGSKNAEPS